MYFVSPSTLPEVFSRLEETNLFLMQNGQEAEAALEEMKAQQRAVRTSMERDADALHAQIDTLKTLIAAEEDEAAELRGRTSRTRRTHGDARRWRDEVKVPASLRRVVRRKRNRLRAAQRFPLRRGEKNRASTPPPPARAFRWSYSRRRWARRTRGAGSTTTQRCPRCRC